MSRIRRKKPHRATKITIIKTIKEISGFFTQLHLIAVITARINLHLISFPQFI